MNRKGDLACVDEETLTNKNENMENYLSCSENKAWKKNSAS